MATAPPLRSGLVSEVMDTPPDALEAPEDLAKIEGASSLWHRLGYLTAIILTTALLELILPGSGTL